MHKSIVAHAVFGVLAISCSSRKGGEPVFEPISVLSPSIPDGTALGVSEEPFELIFSHHDARRFEINRARLSRGAEQISDVEVLAFDSAYRLRVPGPLEVGTYDLDFRVSSEVKDEEMALFRPSGTTGHWTLRFFVGPRFCLVNSYICREVGAESMSVSLRFSSPFAELDRQTVGSSVKLTFDEEDAKCEVSNGIGPLSNENLFLRCALPSNAVGTAELRFDSPPFIGTGGEVLTSCSTGVSLASVSLPFNRDGCGRFSWRP
jgi:hypothetical protein